MKKKFKLFGIIVLLTVIILSTISYGRCLKSRDGEHRWMVDSTVRPARHFCDFCGVDRQR